MGPHIVWDWNGTLLDDAGAVYRAACRVFAAHGLPPVTPERYRAAYCRPIQDFYTRLFGRELAVEEFAGMDEEFHEAYRLEMDGVTLAAGAREVLGRWRGGGGTQSLLSMYRHGELVELVRRLGISGEFARVDGLVGPGGGRKAGHLAAHLTALELDPAEVVLVGDSLDDAAAALELGAGCVLFNGGYHDRAALAVGALAVGALAVGAVPVADTMVEAVDLVSWAVAPRARRNDRSGGSRR